MEIEQIASGRTRDYRKILQDQNASTTKHTTAATVAATGRPFSAVGLSATSLLAGDDLSNASADQYDDPAEGGFNDSFSANPSSAAAVRAEARDVAQRRAGLSDDGDGGGGAEEAPSNILDGNKTVEDVLFATSKIWEERMNSAKLFEQQLGGLTCGDNSDYDDAQRNYRTSRVRTCYGAIAGKEFDVRLPNAVRASRDWFAKLPRQFVLVPTLYSNLTYFGNLMVQVANDMEAIANPGQSFETMLLTRVTCLAAPQFNTKQTLMLLMAGDASVGKSYLMHCNKDMLPPGRAVMMAHMSTLALSDDQNDDFVVLMVEETPQTMTQETVERTGNDGGASFIKTLFTNKIVITRTVAYDKGKRTRQVHVTSKMMTGVFATNGSLVASSPLLKRYLVVKPSFDPEIALKINRVSATSLSEEQAGALLRQQIIAHLVMLAELMIGMGALRQVDMDVFAVVWNRVVKEMALAGHAMIDAKAVIMVQQVVRTLVVMRAVCEACLSEYNIELRVDTNTGEPKRFDDHYQEHFANIESLLVAQEPEIYFGISLCASIFGDETEGKIIEAARRLTGINIRDDVAVLTRKPHLMPNNIATASDGRRSINYFTHYVEMIPPEGRGLDGLNSALISKCLERPSRNNVASAIERMMTKTIEQPRVHLCPPSGDGDYGRIEPKPGSSNGSNGNDKPIKVAMIRKVQLPDDHEARMMDECIGSVGSKMAPSRGNWRYYVAVQALIKYTSQAEAMRKALLRLQHVGTIRKRHIISMPLTADRSAFCKREQHFYGILGYLDFERDPNNVLFFHSHHTLLGSQISALNPANLYDGGDPRLRNLSKEEIARRQVAKTNHSLAAQTPITVVKSLLDFAVFMKRQQLCAMPLASADLKHWTTFTDVCIAMRRDFRQNFGAVVIEDYPNRLLAEAQARNASIDAESHASIPLAKKLEHYTGFDSLATSQIGSVAPPASIFMHNVFCQSGMDTLRSLFVTHSGSLATPPLLDAESAALVERDPEARLNWETARNIYRSYKDADRVATAFLNYAGFSVKMLPPLPGGGGSSQRCVSLTPLDIDPAAVALLRPVSADDRLKNKRTHESIDESLRSRVRQKVGDKPPPPASLASPAVGAPESTVDRYVKNAMLLQTTTRHLALDTESVNSADALSSMYEGVLFDGAAGAAGERGRDGGAAAGGGGGDDDDAAPNQYDDDAPDLFSIPLDSLYGRPGE